MSDCEDGSAYYLRFMSMYIDLGTEVVLKVFVHHTPGKDADSFLLSGPIKKKLLQLKNRKILNEVESDLVLTSAPNPKAFDISLLTTLSINLLSERLTPPDKGWSNPPKNSDESISADLLRLRTIRNLIVCHVCKAQLPQWRFNNEWENVAKIFLRIYRNIAPGEESELKRRIEKYRFRKLDPSNKNKYDAKLKEWQHAISKVQQEVEDAFKTLKDIDKYLKEKSDRYERYIKLLVKGGRFVISSFIEDNVKTQNKTLEDVIKEREDYVRKSIDNQDHLHILYPSDQGDSSKPIDMSTWDITLLATVLLQVLDSSSLDDKVKRAINMINTARKNYAEAALVSLHSDEFAEYSYHLKYSIQFLSGYLDQQKQIKCEEILSECQHISKNADEHQTYFNELENQSLKIKSIQQIYTETVKKTKDILQEMITHGINFKHEHVLELKMITLGSDEEKKQLGETVLTEIWREALERSNDSTDFDVVKKEVSKILTEIRKHKEVTGVAVKQICIFLDIVCCSPHTVLDHLNYFESAEFDQSKPSSLDHLTSTDIELESGVADDDLLQILLEDGPEHENESSKEYSAGAYVSSGTPTWDLDNTCMRLGMSCEHIVLAFAAVTNYHEKTPVLVCLTKTKCTEVPEEFEGFRVLQKPFYPSSKESLEAENSVDISFRGKKSNSLFKNIKYIKETIDSHADNLFQKHTNLEAIRLSLVRATRLGFRKRPCIVLVCRCKSYIPVGESEFPIELQHPNKYFTFKTDVREGYLILCVNGHVITRYANEWNQELAMGCSIGPENEKYSATIGPFVTIKEANETCFLTVRHVFQPLDKPSDQIVGTNLVQPADGDLSRQIQMPNRRCGTVKVAEMNEEIDAALVSICPERIPSRGHFVDVRIDDLDFAGFTVRNYPIYDDGSTQDATRFTANDFYDRIIKFGKESGLRKGTLRISNMAVKVVTETGSIQHGGRPQSHILTGQLQVDSYAGKTFCQEGDSGSAVFHVDRENKLHCIGMVTGIMSDLTCVVTPIQPILKVLGKKINKTLELKNFGQEDMEI